MTSSHASSPDSVSTNSQPRPLWLDIPFEIGILLAVYFVYGFSKWALGGGGKNAVAGEDSLDIIYLEKTLGIFIEPKVQSFFLESHFWINIANSIYTFGYYPSLFLFAIWAYWRHRQKYRRMRTVFVICSSLAFVTFALYPAAPPRFVDTLATHWGVGGRLDSYAPYVAMPSCHIAAMPSCHFAWTLMIGIGIWWMTKSLWGRAIGVMLPIVMLVDIVATANHFILDAAAGAAVLGVSFGLAALAYKVKDITQERNRVAVL